MKGKKQMISLEVNGKRTEFEISHAERILKMNNNGGWKLPEDSPYKFDENGIGIRENKKRDSATEKKADNPESNKPSESN